MQNSSSSQDQAPPSSSRRRHPLEEPLKGGQETPRANDGIPNDGPQRPQRVHPLRQRAAEWAESPPEIQAPPKPRAVLHLPTVNRPLVMQSLIAINVVIFLIGLFAPSINEQFVSMGSAYPPRILRNGEYYRLFSAMFLHANPMHVFFNMYTLYIIGSLSERIMGHSRFLIIYFLGGLTGSVASVLLGNYFVGSIGASGAVFAVWGAEMLHLYQHRKIYGEQMRQRLRSLALWGGLNLVFGLTATSIDNWGHIGGFLGGVFLAWAIGPLFVPKFLPGTPDGIAHIEMEDTAPLNQRYWLIGLYAAGLVAALIFGVMFVGI